MRLSAGLHAIRSTYRLINVLIWTQLQPTKKKRRDHICHARMGFHLPTPLAARDCNLWVSKCIHLTSMQAVGLEWTLYEC